MHFMKPWRLSLASTFLVILMLGVGTQALSAFQQPLEAAPQWVPTRGPEGGRVKSLFATSQKEVYAVGGTRLYRLAEDNTGWTLINALLQYSWKAGRAEIGVAFCLKRLRRFVG